MVKSFNNIEDFYKKYPGSCFWFITILIILPVAFIKVYDVDIWWHMQCGKSILENFAWPDFSQFYFSPVTTDTDSLRTTFLGDILFHLVYWLSGDFGLQMTRLAAVLTACVLIRSMAGKEYKGWHLLLLAVLIVGTYQKQLVRNSLFALFLVPLLFWLWHQIQAKGKTNYLWLFPIVLGIWSCLHGSYLLGFGLLVLILSGDSVDIFRGVSNGTGKKILKYAAVIVLSFIAISLWNPTTQKYYNISRLTGAIKQVKQNDANIVKHAESQRQVKSNQEMQSSSLDKENPGLLTSLLRSLNNTIFKTAGLETLSADFVSPFDKLDRLYVWVALFSGVLGLLIIGLMIRPFRFSIIFPFIMILLSGMGYLRLCGYIPIVTAAIVFHAAGKNEIKPILQNSWLPKISWTLLPLILCFVWSSGVYHYPVSIGTSFNDFGLGRISSYSTKCPDIVFKEYRNHNIFTSTLTGGYLLYRWYPEKKVFIDGFYAPHKSIVMEHLQLMRKPGTNPDFLYDKYNIDVALVEHTRGSLLKTFFKSENWYVKYVDSGMICFVYKPDFYSDIKLPKIYINPDELRRFSIFFRKSIAAFLHTIPNTLYQKGRIKDAIDFSSKYDLLLDQTKTLIDPAFITMTRQLKNDAVAAYGQVNTKAQFYEYKQTRAIEAKDNAEIIENGLKIMEINSGRLMVALNITIAYAKMGFFEKSHLMFEKMIVLAKESKSSFMTDNKLIIVKMFLMHAATARQNNHYMESYDLVQRANNIDTALFSDTKLYEFGVKLVEELNKAGKKNQALMLLNYMKNKYEKSGRWLNDMAWQLFITETGVNNIEAARSYSLKAVATLAKQQSNILDLAYDTLAEITFKQGNHAAACQYLEKAGQFAPEKRKKNYKNRFQCD